MADLPDTYADAQAWKPLPVPAEDVSVFCQIAPVRISFKENPDASVGVVLRVGDSLRLKPGDAGFIQPVDAWGGVIVFEAIG